MQNSVSFYEEIFSHVVPIGNVASWNQRMDISIISNDSIYINFDNGFKKALLKRAPIKVIKGWGKIKSCINRTEKGNIEKAWAKKVKSVK